MSDQIVVVRVELRCAVGEGTYGAVAHGRLDIAELQAPEGRAATDAEADDTAEFPKVGRRGDFGIVCSAAFHRLRLRPHVRLVCLANRAAAVRIKNLGWRPSVTYLQFHVQVKKLIKGEDEPRRDNSELEWRLTGFVLSSDDIKTVLAKYWPEKA